MSSRFSSLGGPSLPTAASGVPRGAEGAEPIPRASEAGRLAIQPILFVIGLLIAILGMAMFIPAAVDLVFANEDWVVFALSAVLSIFVGVSLVLATRGTADHLSLKQAFIMTVLAWIVLPAFAALPFVFSDRALSYTDAFFEAVSGITTTGATVITYLDGLPPGILVWRAILQWLGGLGIVVMAVAILPILQVGGMQLFRTESFETFGKVMPSAAQIAGILSNIYMLLTLTAAIALWAAGMDIFDAVCHSMTTIATGGFANYDQSIGAFNSVTIEMIIAFFMFVASLPFVLVFQAVRGHPIALWRDDQVRLFMFMLGSILVVVISWLIFFKDFALGDALRYGIFNIISVMTGTGYSSTNYGGWGTFAATGFFLITFIGGCAGSTSCGAKIFRFHVLFSVIAQEVTKIRRPNAVFIARYNGQPLRPDIISSVMSFFFLFGISFFVVGGVLSAMGLDAFTAFSGAATALANVGPGVGPTIGPAGSFSELEDPAKWVLAFAMLLGRLEFFTVLVLFTRTFWRA